MEEDPLGSDDWMGCGEATLPHLEEEELAPPTITEPASAGSEREAATRLNEDVPSAYSGGDWRSRLGDGCFPIAGEYGGREEHSSSSHLHARFREPQLAEEERRWPPSQREGETDT